MLLELQQDLKNVNRRIDEKMGKKEETNFDVIGASYSYIIYKFCELLELDHLLPYFPLLKSHKKLMEHDIFWKKCCKHLRWEFYPTPI